MNCCHSSSRGLRSFWAVALLFGACAETSHDMDDGGAPSVDASLDGGPAEDAGDATEEEPPDLPPSAPPEFTTGQTSTGIAATITAANGATNFECTIDGGATSVEGLTISGLNPNTTYSFQVKGSNAYGESDWSTGVNVTTDTGATPFFEDDFASGDLSKSTNGFSWLGSNRVELGAGRISGHAMAFKFGPDADGEDSTSEQRFELTNTLGAGRAEVWIEYWLFIPSNFIHRSQAATSNNKFVALWAENYSTVGDIQMVTEYWRTDDTTSNIRTICMSGSGCAVGDEAVAGNVITRARIGQWVQVRVHTKAGNGDGLVEIWIDGTLEYAIYDYVHHFSGGNNYWRNGFLLGYSNSGFTDRTTFYIDEFKAFDSDPGWST